MFKDTDLDELTNGIIINIHNRKINLTLYITPFRTTCLICVKKVRAFSEEELNKATSSFGTLIGRGGFGKVHLGKYHGAVKVLDVSTVMCGFTNYVIDRNFFYIGEHEK